MAERNNTFLIFVAALVVIALVVLVFGPIWLPYVFIGKPRNQAIDGRMVERKVTVGMTKSQVEAILHFPRHTMTSCVRWTKNSESDGEIVGSSPPWRSLRPGYHTLVLHFDSNGRVTGGRGTWWDADCSDTDLLQLQQGSKSP